MIFDFDFLVKIILDVLLVCIIRYVQTVYQNNKIKKVNSHVHYL